MKQTLRLAYLQSMLYRLELLGDCFVDSFIMDYSLADSNATLIASKIKSNKSNHIQQTYKSTYTQANSKVSTYQTLSDIKHKILACKLCSLSNMADDNARFCGILPKQQEVHAQIKSPLMQQTHIDNSNDSKSQSQSLAKKSLKIAFVVESLRLQHLGDCLDCLDASKSNIMLIDIITKVMSISLESAFILPLFKCVALQNNNLLLTIQNNNLVQERKICGDYLIRQLRFIDYAVFFGERLCRDFFNASLSQTKGKILQYSALGHVLHAVCVHDIMNMITNPPLKRETLTNLNTLKQFIKVNNK
ncbi:hypothetical protein LS73_005805 [Helicobacter muridarum]|uniref:Uncharacterized protein n=1 Tax=Helicobacter muridarum TaxID=216 RepID=A0A099TY49_9HELI|nr:hypothetical protein [Helicobacter muridarum]TLE00044.1 hypothetical protein LS73_005805 [Helicobacter muridarum]STQ86109.1 Uncharacterised protein [Helicobacter muridarum]